MNKLIKFQIITIMLLSYIFVSCKEEANIYGECKIQSFAVTVDGQQIDGIINEEDTTITINGVTSKTSVTAVSYALAEGNIIYPTPESRIGDWRNNEKFKVSLSSTVYKIYTVVLPDYVESSEELKDYTGWETGKEATIKVNEKYGVVTDKFFYDIKNEGASVSNDVLTELFYKQDMNGIRTPVFGQVDEDGNYVGHKGLGAENVIKEDYERSINAILMAKSIKPNLIVFASRKSSQDNQPGFIFTSGNPNNLQDLDTEKYSEMWMDYLRYVKTKGITVDVIGLDNENSLAFTAQKYKTVVETLKAKIEKENLDNNTGLKIPKFIAPEYWTPRGGDSDAVLNNLLKPGGIDTNAETVDIYGTHFYPEHHAWDAHYYKLNYDLTEIIHPFNQKFSDRPIEFWATEPHWDNHDTAKEDLIGYARMAMCCLWDYTDLGMNAFMWWGYPTSVTDLRSSLMHDLSSVVYKSQPIRMEDHDGIDLLANDSKYSPVRFDESDKYNKVNNYPTFNERVHSRAFIRGNEINVYIVNVRYKEEIEKYGTTDIIGASYHDYKFNIEGSEIDGDVSYVQWTDESSFEGDKGKAKLSEDMKSFTMDLPLRSITRFTFKIKSN